MDIALTSMSLSMANTASYAGTAVLNMSLDHMEAAGEGIVKMLEQSVNPNLGQNIDILV